MVGKSKAQTKEDKRRFSLLSQVGCICCKQFGIHNEWIQAHHIVEGNKRRGHQFTLPLCTWHHEGVPPEGMTREQTEALVGPSLKSKKRFDEVFEGEMELLEKVNDILREIEESFV